MLTQRQRDRLCSKLDEAVSFPAEAAAAPGAVSTVWALITEFRTALQSGDYAALAKAASDLLTFLLGTSGNGTVTEVTESQTLVAAAAPRIDWSKLVDVLVKVLPLLLQAA